MEEKLRQEPGNVLKVVLFGPESTGKTTLSRQLADHYNTLWVPEYARDYLQEKWNREQKSCEPEDLIPIAIGQIMTENELTRKVSRLLFCDTDLLETKVYSEAYYLGSCDPVLEKYALQNKYDLYLLTYIDIPWEKDDLRDKPDKREEMFTYFKAALDKYHRPYKLIKGSKEERFTAAVAIIDKLLKQKGC
jgi:NadR type nicotinamide-nucleotide adenylyltransferase